MGLAVEQSSSGLAGGTEIPVTAQHRTALDDTDSEYIAQSVDRGR